MTEAALIRFLKEEIGGDDLARDVNGSHLRTGHDVSEYLIELVEDDTEFVVNVEHLVSICDLTLDGKIDPSELQVIGNCLVMSDCFDWDVESQLGKRIGEVAFQWGNPLINFELTIENVGLWKKYLTDGIEFW